MSMKTPSHSAAPLSPPDPEVSERPQRRTFSVADKLRILEEIERARPGDVGAILRREGLYSSNVGRWRRQRDAGQLHGPCPAGWCLRREAGPPERSPIAGAGGPAVREQAVTVFFG